MQQLIPDFGSLGLTLLAFVVALSVIVFVHEFGHYIVGRWSGIKADVFSIGMGPTLFSRIDKRGTRWQVAAFPVGGYVKFHGDANAASGTADDAAMAAMDADERRHTLHGAPLWARAVTVLAGPVFNFILSVIVFGGFVLWQGVPSNPPTVAAVHDVPGQEVGLLPGDEILSIAGQSTPVWEDFGAYADSLPDESPLTYLVARNGEDVEITAPHPIVPLVGGVTPDSAALAAGIQPGDFILAIDDTPVTTFAQLSRAVKNGNGDQVKITLLRPEQGVINLTLTPKVQDIPQRDGSFETRLLIGVESTLVFDPALRTPGIGEALTAGVDTTVFVVRTSLSGLWNVITARISTCNIGGVLRIAETSGAAAARGLDSFIWFIAVLSTAVGFLNLLPIPVLDGGHLVFHAWEAVTGRPPSERALQLLLSIGLVLVLGIMLFGLSNDLFCP